MSLLLKLGDIRSLSNYLVTSMILLCCATAPAMDFSGPLQNVLVQQNGSVTTYSVSDPVYGTRQGSASTPGSFISTPVNSGGVVAWVASGGAGSTVYYRIYDPGRSNWMAGSASTPATSIVGPMNDSGLVAWQAGNVVYFAVYDPIAGAWNTNNLVPGSYSFLVDNGGSIACLSGTTVVCVTFDPLTRTWKAAGIPSAGSPLALTTLAVNSGVVAWQANNQVYMATYDVSRASWRSTNGGPTGVVNGPFVANSTVSWSSGMNYSVGYNTINGTWAAGSTPPHAAFLVSTASGNPPLFVWFTDLSLGGTGWLWNFGDGATATGRTPYHVFNSLGRYAVVQTVAGATGTSTASTNVATDLAAPVGSIVINNGDSYTRSTNVTLTLSVTDNSGTVSNMRFNNNFTNAASWSAWVPYAASTPWTLSSGDGLKSVYAQFSDPASNILTVSDSITLDSRPPPVAFVTNYFVNESTPSLVVTVQLSNATPFRASVDYATSDDTATAGSDYGGTSGRIIFQPNETSHTFTLFITNDNLVELNETLFINLSNPTNVTLGPPAVVTILDDDPATVTFATNNFTVHETAVQATITATLSAPSGLTSTINYATSNGTAVAGINYNSVSGTLTFAPGQTSQTFKVPVIDNSSNEPPKTVLLYLSHPTNALLGVQSTATLTILDDNPPRATLDSNSLFVASTAGSVNIAVHLSNPFADHTVFVGYATSDGTAKAGVDYVAASGQVVFGSTETNQSFVITLLSGALTGTNKTILIALTNLINATPGLYTSATLTITHDDSPRISSPTWKTNTFRATLSGPAGRSYAIDAINSVSNTPIWVEIKRVTNITGTIEFIDPSATTPQRFYRARQTN